MGVGHVLKLNQVISVDDLNELVVHENSNFRNMCWYATNVYIIGRDGTVQGLGGFGKN